MKNNKSCGKDGIPNEMIKAGKTLLAPVLAKLFNSILTQEKFPAKWRENTLTPIFKKGDITNPANYRGIAVSNALCKVFCTILNTRLLNFLEKHKIIPNCQIGFQRKCRTADHILTVKTVIDKYKSKSTQGCL